MIWAKYWPLTFPHKSMVYIYYKITVYAVLRFLVYELGHSFLKCAPVSASMPSFSNTGIHFQLGDLSTLEPENELGAYAKLSNHCLLAH